MNGLTIAIAIFPNTARRSGSEARCTTAFVDVLNQLHLQQGGRANKNNLVLLTPKFDRVVKDAILHADDDWGGKPIGMVEPVTKKNAPLHERKARALKLFFMQRASVLVIIDDPGRSVAPRLRADLIRIATDAGVPVHEVIA